MPVISNIQMPDIDNLSNMHQEQYTYLKLSLEVGNAGHRHMPTANDKTSLHLLLFYPCQPQTQIFSPLGCVNLHVIAIDCRHSDCLPANSSLAFHWTLDWILGGKEHLSDLADILNMSSGDANGLSCSAAPLESLLPRSLQQREVEL